MNESNFVNWVIAAATLISALAAAIAAFAAWRAARETRKATNAQIAKDILTSYSSREMNDHLLLVTNFYRHYSQSVDKGFIEVFKLKSEMRGSPFESKWNEINDARRQIYWLFRTANHLFKYDLISQEVVMILTSTMGYGLFHRAVVPMSRATYPGKDEKKAFAWVDEMAKQFPPPKEELEISS